MDKGAMPMCNCTEMIPDMRYAAVEIMPGKYQGSTEKTIPVLTDNQEIFGHIPEEAVKTIAAAQKIPSGKIFEAAPYYDPFHREARGQNIIGVCTGTVCHVQDRGKILNTIEKFQDLSAYATA